MKLRRVCLVPQLRGVGGMVSFQHKLATNFTQRGIEVTYRLEDEPYQAVLVIGGTRQVAGLWRARRRGIPVVQRLDGMNWLHRQSRTGWRHYLRAEYGNWLLELIRRRLADRIVYQSQFSQHWWEGARGPAGVPSRVIYNGVDLATYTPFGGHQRPQDHWRVLLVEGSLMGGYEIGLETAVALASGLAQHTGRKIELMVAGRVAPEVRQRWEAQLPGAVELNWAGLVPGARIPEIDRSAHLLYSADINPACPNAVIEALACGLPVAAFDTGALPELVPATAGAIVPYGGDPWRLAPPDIGALVSGVASLLDRLELARQAARRHAEAEFSLEKMANGYLEALAG